VFILNKRVYLDEFGVSLSLYRSYGYAPENERLCEKVPFQRGENLSVLGGLTYGGDLPTYSKLGSMKRVDVEHYLEKVLLPDLGKGYTLILDNATIHHGGRIAEIVASFGCCVLYLPAYSPDLNPIEMTWSWVKTRIRALRPRDLASRLLAVSETLAVVPKEFAPRWFQKCNRLL
jgi:transposase